MVTVFGDRIRPHKTRRIYRRITTVIQRHDEGASRSDSDLETHGEPRSTSHENAARPVAKVLRRPPSEMIYYIGAKQTETRNEAHRLFAKGSASGRASLNITLPYRRVEHGVYAAQKLTAAEILRGLNPDTCFPSSEMPIQSRVCAGTERW